jgi:outer membrane protein assembly factor BamC
MTKAVIIGISIIFLTSGCSKLMPKFDKVMPDTRKEYQKSKTLPDLEVPPDLSTEAIRDRMAIPEGGQAARYSTYQERRADRQRAEQVEKAQTSAIRVLEDEYVLAVEGAAVQVWPRLREFWQGLGYTLELDDVELGVIETAWTTDESELSREKFKVFADPGEEVGTTVLYISHEGEELAPEGEELVWRRTERDPDIVRKVVERLHDHLSGGSTALARVDELASDSAEGSAPNAVPERETRDEADAGAAPAARSIGTAAPVTTGARHAEIVSVGGGKVYLTVAQDFPTAWKTTGKALEKAGVDVKDSDKGRGVYLVEVAPEATAGEEPGMWNKLKFWDRVKGEEFQVSLTGVGEKTEVVVLDKDGRWETGDQAGQLLSKLHDALNSGRI